MATCSKCGVALKDGDKYCRACGMNAAGGALADKKARVTGQENRWKKPVAIAVAVIAVAGALWMAKSVYLAKQMGAHPMFAPLRDASLRTTKAAVVKDEGGDVRIPLTTIDDGQPHFFAYQAGAKTVTFFVMKAKDGTIKTAFDACMACNHAKLGYRQEGDLVVCNNCGMGFRPMDIGAATGGCNPIVMNKSVDGNLLIVKAKDLEAGAQYF